MAAWRAMGVAAAATPRPAAHRAVAAATAVMATCYRLSAVAGRAAAARTVAVRTAGVRAAGPAARRQTAPQARSWRSDPGAAARDPWCDPAPSAQSFLARPSASRRLPRARPSLPGRPLSARPPAPRHARRTTPVRPSAGPSPIDAAASSSAPSAARHRPVRHRAVRHPGAEDRHHWRGCRSPPSPAKLRKSAITARRRAQDTGSWLSMPRRSRALAASGGERPGWTASSQHQHAMLLRLDLRLDVDGDLEVVHLGLQRRLDPITDGVRVCHRHRPRHHQMKLQES